MEIHQHSQGDGQNFWNFIFSLFFILVLAGVLWFFYMRYGGYPTSVPPFDALLMALASFRITRLMVYDKIARWFRDLFVTTHKSGILYTISELLGCPWCIGFWSTLVIVVAYFTFAWAWLVIFFLAVAGVGSLIQLYANNIGWKAEYFKLKVKEKEALLQTKADRTSLGS